MGMPRNLLLVRHGQSEGNVILKDPSLFTDEFLARHSSQWRLTALGVQQAQAAGRKALELAIEWSKDDYPVELLDAYRAYSRGEGPEPDPSKAGEWSGTGKHPDFFARYYTSPYLRAMETAANMGLPGANWYINLALRERNYGDFDRAHKSNYGPSLAEKKIVPFYWKAPNGESIADMCVTRLKGELGTLSRECDGKDVVIVCHGEVIEGFAALIERMPQEDYIAWLASDDPSADTRNGQLIQYSRVNPSTGEMEKHLNYKRGFVPLEPERDFDWRPVQRQTFSNEQLLSVVAGTPALLG